MKLFIGCSSSNDIPKKYLSDCNDYLNELLINNDVVFGACPTGLMGMSYNIAKVNGNKVIGICPEAYKADLQEIDCDEEILTSSISERTDKLIENCDALIFLPGGIGTIYEFFASVEYKRSNEFNKPIIIYNSNHYFDKLLDFLSSMYDQEFTSEKVKENYYISDSALDTLNYIKNYFK